MKDITSIRAFAGGILFGIAYVAISMVTGSILAGAALACVLFVVAQLLAPDNSVRLLICAFAAVVCSGTLAYFAASSEITGKAVHYRPHGRGVIAERVTRSDAPAKFRQATNFNWGLSLLCGAIAVTTYMFRHKIEASDPFHVGRDED